MKRRRPSLALAIILAALWFSSLFVWPSIQLGDVVFFHQPGQFSVHILDIDPARPDYPYDFTKSHRSLIQHSTNDGSAGGRLRESIKLLPQAIGWELTLWLPGSSRPHVHGNSIYIPYLTLALLFAVPTSVARLRQRRPGHCACGYDLTGNQPGECPECGRSITLAN